MPCPTSIGDSMFRHAIYCDNLTESTLFVSSSYFRTFSDLPCCPRLFQPRKGHTWVMVNDQHAYGYHGPRTRRNMVDGCVVPMSGLQVIEACYWRSCLRVTETIRCRNHSSFAGMCPSVSVVSPLLLQHPDAAYWPPSICLSICLTLQSFRVLEYEIHDKANCLLNEWMDERFNEKSQDKKGHKATYTCPADTRRYV